MNINPVYISSTTIDDTWFKLLYALKEHGRRYLITKGSYEGQYRLAFDDVAGFIKYPHQRPLAPIMPEGLPPPTSDQDIEDYFVNYLMDGDIKDKEDYKYGTFISGGEYELPNFNVTYLDDSKMMANTRWKRDDNRLIINVPNQLEWIINHFKTAGFGNEHCTIQVGYPESSFAYDLPYTNEQERKTSPCLRMLDFRIIEDDSESVKMIKCNRCQKIMYDFLPHQHIPTTEIQSLYCKDCDCVDYTIEFYKINYLTTKVVYRSWDLFGGWPTNIGGFTLLNEYVANELGVEPGPLSFTCKSLHCYEFQLDVLNKRLGK
jgi:thymidylate synthase